MSELHVGRNMRDSICRQCQDAEADLVNLGLANLTVDRFLFSACSTMDYLSLYGKEGVILESSIEHSYGTRSTDRVKHLITTFVMVMVYQTKKRP